MTGLVAPRAAMQPASAGLGTLCLGGGVSFLGPVLRSASDGTVALPVATAMPAAHPSISIAPGETWHFQAWYRDPGMGSIANLSDAVGVTFE